MDFSSVSPRIFSSQHIIHYTFSVIIKVCLEKKYSGEELHNFGNRIEADELGGTRDKRCNQHLTWKTARGEIIGRPRRRW